MANVDNCHGLRPLMRTLAGGAPGLVCFKKAVGYGTALFLFDAINQVADGSIEASATPGTTLYSGVNLIFGEALKATEHLVMADPNAVFEAQGDDGGAATLDEADRGLNANLVLTAGNANTMISGHEIDASTKAVGATLDMKLLDKLAAVDNAYGAFSRFEIVFNKHRMNPAVAGL